MSTTTGTGRPFGEWFKSSYSDNGGAQCVEACPQPSDVGMRDSKCLGDSAGYDVVRVSRPAFAAFITHLRS
ncbi:DUF397 domain-containing protein [Streptomyces goshikiensis]|uniref:DUF397 domain-containing protein n=1 Tax=Streptomyces goshikiensis TaxID=1942 RepID=UPI0036474F2B